MAFLSLGVAALLLLLQLGSWRAELALETLSWVGLAMLAGCAAVWLVMLVLWAWLMPQSLLDGPSVTSPWRGTVVALAGLVLGGLLLWVGVWGLDPLYAAFGLFVAVVLIGVRAALVKLNLRHGLFLAAHDGLEVGMWALWACAPWLLWQASGRAFEVQLLKTLAWLPLVFAMVVLALAHVPAVLQARLRALVLVLGLALGVAWLARPGVLGGWASGLLGLNRPALPVTLVLTDSGCNAANLAMDRRVCGYEPNARHATLRHARWVSSSNDGVVVQLHMGPRKGCVSAQEAAALPWQRLTLRKQELIAMSQHVRPSPQECTALEQE